MRAKFPPLTCQWGSTPSLGSKKQAKGHSVALSARLEIRQGQGLVITPQLQQAIKLLQMSNLEVEAFIDAELERNPLLQREEGDNEPSETPEAETPDVSEHAADAEARADLDVTHDEASPGERATGDAEGAADAGGAIDWSKAGSGGSFDHDGEGFEGALTREPTLSEHLQAQLAASGLSPMETVIAGVLIDAVDEGGYLRAEVADVAERLGCDEAVVEKVLGVIQGFDPVGVAARDVRECLMIQLKDRNRYDPAIAALLDNLPLLAKRDLTALRKVCGVDDEDLREMIAEVRGLTPKPGAAFGGEPVESRGPRRLRPRGARRPVERRAELRHPAQGADGPALSRPRLRPVEDRPGKDLRFRLRGPGQLADEEPRPAGAHDPQGLVRDRPPAGRLPGLWRAAPAAAEPEDRRRRHRHARVHGQPGDLEQVPGHAARRVRDEVLLHLRHRLVRGRRGPFRGKRPRPDQAS